MATIQVRIAEEDKKAVEKILKMLGIDVPTAIRMFFKKIELVKGIPFGMTIETELDENGLTEDQVKAILQAEKEAEAGIGISPDFDDVEEAIKYLRSDKNDN